MTRTRAFVPILLALLLAAPLSPAAEAEKPAVAILSPEADAELPERFLVAVAYEPPTNVLSASFWLSLYVDGVQKQSVLRTAADRGLHTFRLDPMQVGPGPHTLQAAVHGVTGFHDGRLSAPVSVLVTNATGPDLALLAATYEGDRIEVEVVTLFDQTKGPATLVVSTSTSTTKSELNSPGPRRVSLSVAQLDTGVVPVQVKLLDGENATASRETNVTVAPAVRVYGWSGQGSVSEVISLEAGLYRVTGCVGNTTSACYQLSGGLGSVSVVALDGGACAAPAFVTLGACLLRVDRDSLVVVSVTQPSHYRFAIDRIG